jgi:aspartate kinase
MAVHSVSEDDLVKARRALEDCGEVSILNKMAILSLVGAEMKNMVGVAGRMFSTLGENNVNIEMISQGKHCNDEYRGCADDNFRCKRDKHILCDRGVRSKSRHEHPPHKPFHIFRIDL